MFLIQQDSSNIYWLSDDVVFLPADRSMDSERSLHVNAEYHKLFQLLILTNSRNCGEVTGPKWPPKNNSLHFIPNFFLITVQIKVL